MGLWVCVKYPVEHPSARFKKNGDIKDSPGAMASREEQVAKNLNVEDAQQEKETKDAKEQDADKGEPGDYCVPRGNRRRFPVRRPILQYRWAGGQRLGEPQARLTGEHRERAGEMRRLMETLRGEQLSHSLRAVSTEPPRHDHHDFCLVP